MTDKYSPPIYEKYDSPAEVRNDASLTHTEKMSILETWAEDSRAIATAAAEGMTAEDGEHAPLLADIEAVIIAMKEKS